MTHSLAGHLAAGIGPFGPWEILLVLAVIMLLFGAKRLPELAKGFGKSIKEFKKATTEVEEDITAATKEEPPPAPKNGTTKVAAKTERTS
ncbi:MAG TPA: twin-arginine translocase TatA/TatE family subunit [Opitutaceae bacterium]